MGVWIQQVNDVFLAGKKVCGVLTEVAAPGQHLVVGIGINVNNSFADAPAEVRDVGTAVCDTAGRSLHLTDVLLDVLDALDGTLAALADAQAPLPAAWRARSLLDGRRVTIEAGQRQIAGICCGIADDGSLELRSEAGNERIYAGVVSRFE